jgi:hypothetical protein
MRRHNFAITSLLATLTVRSVPEANLITDFFLAFPHAVFWIVDPDNTETAF